MKLDKTLLKEQQYQNPTGYRSRLALLDYALEKFNPWEWTASHYNFSSVKNVLEVGGGTGDFWKYVSAPAEDFDKIQLTDFAEGMLNTARETLKDSPLLSKMQFEIADVEALHYADGAFDAVFAHLMLYHPKSQEKALSEISRVLKPEGWVGITTLNRETLRELFLIAHEVDARFPDFALTAEPFAEHVADQLLPRYFERIKKDAQIVMLRITDIAPLISFIHTHPVVQSLQLGGDFFNAFEAKASEQIAQKGFIETRFMPVSYLCEGRRKAL